jgi:hypothetical protein
MRGIWSRERVPWGNVFLIQKLNNHTVPNERLELVEAEQVLCGSGPTCAKAAAGIVLMQ